MEGHMVAGSDCIEFVVCCHGDRQVCMGAVDI